MTKGPFNDSFPLKRYGRDLTMLAQQGAFSPLAGYETAMNRIFRILLRKAERNDFYNPVILHTHGMTRWQLVAEVTRRIAVGEAPESLSSYHVIALDYEALFSHLPDDHSRQQSSEKVSFRQEVSLTERTGEGWLDDLLKKSFWPPLETWVAPDVVQQRLQAIFIALFKSESPYLLSIDPLDRLLGSMWEQYSIHAAELLKPALARRQIQLIGGCTPAQYQRYIAQSAVVQRRFQGVLIKRDLL